MVKATVAGFLASALASAAMGDVITTFSASADLFTYNGSVNNLTNRLLVSGAYVSYLTFDLTGLNPTDLGDAKLRIYMAYASSNDQNSRPVTVTIMASADAALMTDTGIPAVGATYTPTLGTESETINVTGSVAGQYWEWDVTSLLTGSNGVGNGIVGFAVTRADAGNPPFRFTDRDPNNDSAPANAGFAPQLVISTVPEPAGVAILSCGLLPLLRRRKR